MRLVSPFLTWFSDKLERRIVELQEMLRTSQQLNEKYEMQLAGTEKCSNCSNQDLSGLIERVKRLEEIEIRNQKDLQTKEAEITKIKYLNQ